MTTMRTPMPFFTVAAWFSLLVPLLATDWLVHLYFGGASFLGHDRSFRKAAFVALALLCVLSFLAGCVSLWGVKANGALVILPPALLGIVASAVWVALAHMALLLAGLPVC